MAWVEYEGTFKDALKISEEAGAPFKTVRGPKNGYEWQDSGKLLKLEENTFSSSGAIHVRVAEGWRVAFRIATENTDYFNDNIRDAYLVKGEKDDTPFHDEVDEVFVYEDKSWIQENQSNVLFTLYENDYLSVDVDGDHSNIANFSLNKGGESYDVKKDREMSDDTFVRMIKAWYWVDDLPPTTYELDEGQGSEEDDRVGYEGNFNENEVITDEDIKQGNESEGGDIDPTEKPLDEQKPTIEPEDITEDGDNDTVVKEDDDDDTDGDDTTSSDDDNYSILLVLGAVAVILVGAVVILRGGRSAE